MLPPLGFDSLVTFRLPEEEQVSFLATARGLTRRTIVRVEMRRSVIHGVAQVHMALQALVQIAGLRNVNRKPLPIFSLLGVDIISRQGLESSVQGVNLVSILSPRLPGPVDKNRSGLFRLAVAAK